METSSNPYPKFTLKNLKDPLSGLTTAFKSQNVSIFRSQLSRHALQADHVCSFECGRCCEAFPTYALYIGRFNSLHSLLDFYQHNMLSTLVCSTLNSTLDFYQHNMLSTLVCSTLNSTFDFYQSTLSTSVCSTLNSLLDFYHHNTLSTSVCSTLNSLLNFYQHNMLSTSVCSNS